MDGLTSSFLEAFYPIVHSQWALQLALNAILDMSRMPLMLDVYNQESGYRDLYSVFPVISVSSIRHSILMDI